MRTSFAVAAVAAASSVGLLGGQAGAASPEANGTCLVSNVPDPSDFQVQGVGISTASDTIATQVECRLHDPYADYDYVIAKSGYKVGRAAALATHWVNHMLPNFVTCVRVDWLDSAGNFHSTPWRPSGASSDPLDCS